MGDIKITASSELGIKGEAGAEHVHIDIDPLSIQEVQNIAPLAAHIKEVNHIDPISIEALHVSEVRNIEPIIIEKFNVTDLPMVNMTLRQIPTVDMNVRRLPPVSIGTHQNFHVPSSYTVRAKFLGIEFLRIYLDGHTTIIPKERYRREQERVQNQSFPIVAVGGNPAIPSRHYEKSSITYYPASHCSPKPMHHKRASGRSMAHSYAGSGQQMGNPGSRMPASNFRISQPGSSGTYGGSSVNSGG